MYPTNDIASTANIYNCIIDGKSYTLKKFYNDFDKEHAEKLDNLSKIKNKYIIEPQILIKDKSNLNIGYLSETFYNSNSINVMSNSNYTIRNKIKVLKEAKKAILEMHSLGIIHTDLHPGNILFHNDSVKLCDFDNCIYLSFKPKHHNYYKDINETSEDVDIFIFNLSTIHVLYGINWYEIYKLDYIFKDKFNTEQKKIWQKIRNKQPLTNKDFLINHY